MYGVDIVSYGSSLSVIGGLGRAASTLKNESLTSSSGGACSFSSLANQLEGSSRRAEERDKDSSWVSLRAFTSAVSEDLHEYRNGKQMERDSEVPKTDDPILLQRARQATSYLHSLNRDSNPFKGLAPDQLELIAHDVDGPYTKNERHAAMREQYRQDQCWRQRVIAAASQEYLATGKQVNFLKEILRYVEELPPLDRSGFPENYEQELAQKIAQEIKATPADTSMGLRNGDIFLQVMFDAWSHEKRVSSDRIEKERVVHEEPHAQ